MKKKMILPTKGRKEAEQAGKVKIRFISTGVRGLDEIMKGGLHEFSFNIIAGAPGSGKTTLANQIVFANSTVEKPALYFAGFGEPAVKLLRYQQQYTFFDPAKINKAVRFINLSDTVVEKGLDSVLEAIIKEVSACTPGLVVVDSFRNVKRKTTGEVQPSEFRNFIERLALFLTSWQATTFLVGEYSEREISEDPVFTLADGLFWLSQHLERNSVVRKLQIIKSRGHESVPGLHTIRITEAGLQAYSRTLGFQDCARPLNPKRLSIGVPELDAMMGGGILEGDSVLISGPSGTGKSALATQFLAEGLRHGEAGIAAIFEERPRGYVTRAASFGLDLSSPQLTGKLEILFLRPLDLSVDETMQEILDAVKRVNAKRLVIDSLVGFEMALAPGFREDFRESLYRMIAALTGAGVTILTTVEVEDSFTSFQFSHYAISFLTDDIIRLRYVEIEGQLRKIVVVVKMRGGNHEKDIREYIIKDKGVVIISPRQTEYAKLTSGLPEKVSQHRELPPELKAAALKVPKPR